MPKIEATLPRFPLERRELKDLLVPIRRHLHQHPELGFEEFETGAYIRRVLGAYGLDVQGPIAHTGWYVDIEGKYPGEGIGYRADIDALPIQDVKTVEYVSKIPGKGHLCGHDAHTTIAIGVALSLHELREHIHGKVRVFFQPKEEGMPSGAPEMIREGILDGLKAVYAVHVDPTLPVGQYGLRVGAITAATHSFEVHLKGTTTGHSARPHQVVDTIWVATQVMNSLYQLVSRVHDTRNSAVITLCQIHGGTALNVVPDSVSFGGTLRCINRDDQMTLLHRIQEVCRQIGRLHGAEVEIDVLGGAPPVENDAGLIKTAEETLVDLHGPDAIFEVPVSSMGAEDFAHYLDHVPGALIRAGTSAGASTRYPLHDSRFDIAEDALPITVELMTHVLINHLRKRS